MGADAGSMWQAASISRVEAGPHVDTSYHWRGNFQAVKNGVSLVLPYDEANLV